MGLVTCVRATLECRLRRLSCETVGPVLPAEGTALGIVVPATQPLRSATSTADLNLGLFQGTYNPLALH